MISHHVAASSHHIHKCTQQMAGYQIETGTAASMSCTQKHVLLNMQNVSEAANSRPSSCFFRAHLKGRFQEINPTDKDFLWCFSLLVLYPLPSHRCGHFGTSSGETFTYKAKCYLQPRCLPGNYFALTPGRCNGCLAFYFMKALYTLCQDPSWVALGLCFNGRSVESLCVVNVSIYSLVPWDWEIALPNFFTLPLKAVARVGSGGGWQIGKTTLIVPRHSQSRLLLWRSKVTNLNPSPKEVKIHVGLADHKTARTSNLTQPTVFCT